MLRERLHPNVTLTSGPDIAEGTQLLVANFPEPHAIAAAKDSLLAVLFPFAGVPPHMRACPFRLAHTTTVISISVASPTHHPRRGGEHPEHLDPPVLPPNADPCPRGFFFFLTTQPAPAPPPRKFHAQSTSWRASSPTAPCTTSTTTRPPPPRPPSRCCWRRPSGSSPQTGIIIHTHACMYVYVGSPLFFCVVEGGRGGTDGGVLVCRRRNGDRKG